MPAFGLTLFSFAALLGIFFFAGSPAFSESDSSDDSEDPSGYPDIQIQDIAGTTGVTCDGQLLVEIKGNRFLRFRATPEDENWVGSEKSPADLGWVYRDEGAKGMDVLSTNHENNPEKGLFVLRVTGKKPQFESRITAELTAKWIPEVRKFQYSLNTRLECDLEDWYTHSRGSQRSPQSTGSKIWTEVLDYCIEGISWPERLMSPDKESATKPLLYEWFVKSHDGKNWKKWPKTQIPFPVRPGDYITIREVADPSPAGSSYGFLDMKHGGWLTRIDKTPAPVVHEICWARYDVHMNLENALPPRGSAKNLSLEFEMTFEPVEPERAREIVATAQEIPWRDAPEYDLALFSWDNRFDKMLKDLPSEEAGGHSLWWPSGYDCNRDTTTGFDDNYSLTIKRTGEETRPSAFSTLSWRFPFHQYNGWRKRHRFSAMVKTDGCTSGSVRLGHYSSDENVGDIYYGGRRSFKPDGTRITDGVNWQFSRPVAGTTDWTTVTLEFVPMGHSSTLFLEHGGAGQCWFDNVKIEVLEEPFDLENTLTDEQKAKMESIAAMLPEKPEGMGNPITDRAAWEAIGKKEQYRVFVPEAEKLLSNPLPELTEALYLEFSQTGNRNPWQMVAGWRHSRLKPLVMAECIENQGRFLPTIESLIAELCSEPSWVLPAHDKTLDNYYGRKVSIDLWSSAFAWEMATTDWLLGDKLTSHTREMIRENIRWRILEPFREMSADPAKAKGWMGVKHNWNSVCLSGVAGAILQQVESPLERARFLMPIIDHSQNYLNGYEADGYCSEGLGYWNYGMGHYVLLAQTILQATGGKIDLYDRPLVDEIAKFARKITIINGISPAFADCPVKTEPEHNLMYFLNRKWNMGLPQYSIPSKDKYLFDSVFYAFDSMDAIAQDTPATPTLTTSLRDWFDVTGILVSRPEPDSACQMGVAMKGGNNNEHHNHNDLGSYVVVVGNSTVLVDPGTERYTARTFSPQRYESKVLNSYGHPVPLVSGQLQRVGAEARAQILRTEFSDKTDLLEMDIRSAYDVEGLISLVRTLQYNRQGQGNFNVRDSVEFASPQSFGTALITGGTCEKQEDGRLRVRNGNESVLVEIDTAGAPYTINIEPIDEQTQIKVTRIGINLTSPVSKAAIAMKIEPVPAE